MALEDVIGPARPVVGLGGQDIPHSTVQPLDIEDAPPVRSKIKILAILIALYLSLFIAALDATIIATSVPTISADLHSANGYIWIGGAYLLANAAAGPIFAKCSDIWGRKPALMTAVVIFAAASAFAATSSTMRKLIAARALQGTACGGLILLVNITISDLFSLRRRTLFLGLVEVMWALAGGLGPVVGGAFTQLVSWRWCFWINLPVCGVTFILLLFCLDVHNPRTRLRDGFLAVDWFGTLSMLAVTLMLLLGLDFGGTTFAWSSPRIICLIVFGTLMIAFFLFSEKRLARYPLMPLSVFNNRSNNAALAVAFCHGMTFIASEYYLPLYFQSAKEASPLHSGLLILPITISEAIMGIVCGIIIHQTGRFREVVWFGMTLLAVGTGLFIHLDRTSSVGQIVVFELVEGMGSGCLFEAPIIAIQAVVSQADTATATATLGFVRNVATAMGVVFGGVVFQNGMDIRATSLLHSGLNKTVVDALSGGNAAANVELIRGIENHAQRAMVKDAFAWSMRNMWILFTAVSCLGLVASAFIAHKHLSREHTETRTGIEKMTERGEGNANA